jgi:hypothetical protein
VYSAGNHVTCIDPLSGAPQAGVDGCATVDSIFLQPLGDPVAPILDPFTRYLDLMNPVNPASCGYHYMQPTCGAGDPRAFWNAICQALTEAPPSPAEANYIDTNFAQFGIHSAGCLNVDYDALAAGWVDGQLGVQWAVTHLGTYGGEPSNVWEMPNFNGQWPVTPIGFLRRANNGLMVPTNIGVYWIAFYEAGGASKEQRLTCATGNSYRVSFREIAPVNYNDHGAWSLVLYDQTNYLYGFQSRVFGVQGTTPVIPDSFLISSDCSGKSDCILCPPYGTFYLILRGWNPTSQFQAGTTYAFPKIKACKGKGQC